MNVDVVSRISQKMLIKILFFPFLNQDFLFTIRSPTVSLCNRINNIYMEGILSQISYGRSFYFMTKQRETFCLFLLLKFLGIIK